MPGSWPGAPEWVPPAGVQAIDLLSDVHLHPALPRTFAAWRQHLLHTSAEVVLMLGDLFEVWVGDDARHASIGCFEAQCADVLREASRRRTLAFLPGNRDFLVGPDLLTATGVLPLADPTVLCAFEKRWLLTHGDALCLADTAYLRFRAEVRSPDWQARFLAQPLSERQAQARAMREASSQHQARRAPEGYADVDDQAAMAWLDAALAPVLVHGHTHRPNIHALPGGRERQVLGDWDLDGAPARARILRLTAAGLQPIDLAAPGPGPAANILPAP